MSPDDSLDSCRAYSVAFELVLQVEALEGMEPWRSICIYLGLGLCEHAGMAAAVGVKRVLLADDDAGLRSMLQEAFELEGLAVETCRDALTAIARIAAFQPAVMVLDADLPPTGGFAIVERLRERGNLIPIIFLASVHDQELQKVCEEWPSMHYLAKPFSLQELLLALARA